MIGPHISMSYTQIFIVVRAGSKRVLIVNSGLYLHEAKFRKKNV